MFFLTITLAAFSLLFLQRVNAVVNVTTFTTPMVAPAVRNSHSLSLLNDTLVVFGGLPFAPLLDISPTFEVASIIELGDGLGWKSVQVQEFMVGEQNATRLLPNRAEHVTLNVDNGLLLIGGVDSRENALADVVLVEFTAANIISYTNLTDSISDGEDDLHKMTSRWGHCGAINANGTDIFVFGGRNNSLVYNDLYVLSRNNETNEFDSWTLVPVTNSTPSARHGHSCSIIGNSMYVYGGKSLDETVLSDMHILNLETLEWMAFEGETVGPLYGHSAIVYNDKMILFGGFTPKPTVSTATYQFTPSISTDLATNETDVSISSIGTFTNIVTTGSIPRNRFLHSSTLWNDQFMIVAGGVDAETSQSLSDVFILDLGFQVWATMGSNGFGGMDGAIIDEIDNGAEADSDKSLLNEIQLRHFKKRGINGVELTIPKSKFAQLDRRSLRITVDERIPCVPVRSDSADSIRCHVLNYVPHGSFSVRIHQQNSGRFSKRAMKNMGELFKGFSCPGPHYTESISLDGSRVCVPQPFVASIRPSRGKAGSKILLTGNAFNATGKQPTVLIGGTECTVTEYDDASIRCTVNEHYAVRNAPVIVSLDGLGNAAKNASVTFDYQLNLEKVQVMMKSWSALTKTKVYLLTLLGNGFVPMTLGNQVRVSNQDCFITGSTSNTIKCELTTASSVDLTSENVRNLKISMAAFTPTISEDYDPTKSPFDQASGAESDLSKVTMTSLVSYCSDAANADPSSTIFALTPNKQCPSLTSTTTTSAESDLPTPPNSAVFGNGNDSSKDYIGYIVAPILGAVLVLMVGGGWWLFRRRRRDRAGNEITATSARNSRSDLARRSMPTSYTPPVVRLSGAVENNSIHAVAMQAISEAAMAKITVPPTSSQPSPSSSGYKLPAHRYPKKIGGRRLYDVKRNSDAVHLLNDWKV